MNIGRSLYYRYDFKRRKRRSRPIFSVSDDQRLRHIHIIGKTGVGKSTLLENMIVQDIHAGNGFAVFDPHGSLADAVLALIPKKRRKDVVLFDPSDREYPLAFNIFDGVPTHRRPFVASSVVDCFKSIWGASWGPQLEMFLYAGAAALLDFPDATLIGLKYILTSPKYRARVLGHVQDPVLRDFWLKDFAEHMPEKEQRERTLSTLNKIGQIITDPAIRNFIGQPRSRVAFKPIMDNKEIFIARLPQGELGIQKSSLIGSLLLSSLHLTALQRKGPPFHVYVDEFHNFGSGFKEMLSGIRKFGVSMTLCHQFLGQAPDDLVDAIVGTVGTSIAFQLGVNDADRLAKTFHLKPEDLTALAPYTAYVNAGPRTDLIVMDAPPGRTYPSSPKAILKHSRSQYGSKRAHVERRITTFIGHAS